MTTTTPTVSIVMGAFNARRFIAEAIRSLLAQTFSDFELIVVDDGSTDDTLQILRSFAKRDSRVWPIQIAHGGIVAAANAGLQAARAELIARADADDVSLPQRLQKQFDFLQANPQVVAVGSRMIVVEPYGSPLRTTEHRLDHESIESELLAGSGWALPQPAAMFRKSAVARVGGYRNDYPWSEDLDLFLRLAEIGRLANLPDALVKYRVHPNSTNWRHAQTQLANKPKLLAEAYRRRGRPMPTELTFKDYWNQPPAERFANWVWYALRDGNIRGARRHACSALKTAPFSLLSWRATYWAIRGY